MALSIVGLLGVGLLLAGCGGDTGSGSGSTSSSDAAKQQFLNDRGGGTPGPGTPVVAGQGGRPGVFGTIDKIDGNNITVKSQADGSETVVQPASGAMIGKQADAQASDVVVGANIVAMGAMNGSSLDAQTIQIGNGNFIGFGGGGGGRGFNGTPGTGNGQGGGGGRFRVGANGTPGPNESGTPGPGGPGGPGRNFAAGKVASVNGNTITLNMPNGSTGTVATSNSTRYQKEATIQLSDLKVGDNVVAGGQLSGDGTVFEANSIQVVTNFGGFGGGRGRQAQGTPTP
jgi:hypothetical protein